MKLDKRIRFILGSGKHKYTAILPTGQHVSFGHVDYEHYKDSVPKSHGGGLWSHKDHGDLTRRKQYRTRHGAILCKATNRQCITIRYSPAWFSYYFLW